MGFLISFGSPEAKMNAAEVRIDSYKTDYAFGESRKRYTCKR